MLSKNRYRCVCLRICFDFRDALWAMEYHVTWTAANSRPPPGVPGEQFSHRCHEPRCVEPSHGCWEMEGPALKTASKVWMYSWFKISAYICLSLNGFEVVILVCSDPQHNGNITKMIAESSRRLPPLLLYWITDHYLHARFSSIYDKSILNGRKRGETAMEYAWYIILTHTIS